MAALSELTYSVPNAGIFVAVAFVLPAISSVARAELDIVINVDIMANTSKKVKSETTKKSKQEDACEKKTTTTKKTSTKKSTATKKTEEKIKTKNATPRVAFLHFIY